MKLPKARSRNIVVQNLEREVLIYDLLTDNAFCLNDTLAKVFNACDGETSFEELKRKYPFTDDLIYFALDELKRNGLIEGETINHFGSLTRREVIRRIGLATMMTIPVITGITAPQAANASSPTCPVGTLTTADPLGRQGRGGQCLCRTNVGIGNNCGRGAGNLIGCRSGCVCIATDCTNLVCEGLCA